MGEGVGSKGRERKELLQHQEWLIKINIPLSRDLLGTAFSFSFRFAPGDEVRSISSI